MLSVLLVLADKPADVVSGAALTLVLPLGLTLIAFVVWYVAFRRNSNRD